MATKRKSALDTEDQSIAPTSIKRLKSRHTESEQNLDNPRGRESLEASPDSGQLSCDLPSPTRCGEGQSPKQHDATNGDSQPHCPMRLTVIEEGGDLFGAPPHAVLVHACNAIGSWGGGIAVAFKQHYPAAYKNYNRHCKQATASKTQIRGTALLIPPHRDPSASISKVKDQCSSSKSTHYIGCLFTSAEYGRRRDKPAQILEATRPAMLDLLRAVANAQKDGAELSEIWMCKINSGLFAVPWQKTRALLESIEVEDGMPQTVWVYDREEPLVVGKSKR
ncbi:ADP-ribose 1''-phosphate phosphatase [Elasticomyces elasticus]|nr:ADP-ribose 1''-phosphate phosphatase [Elasticomyces elasticus]